MEGKELRKFFCVYVYGGFHLGTLKYREISIVEAENKNLKLSFMEFWLGFFI